MVASTDIKFFVHTNGGAPQLQNAYGSMINVLDACLVNGVQVGVVSLLTVSGNTVTATFEDAHNLKQYQVIKITGAAQSEFNGEHRVLTIPNSNKVTFGLATTPSVATATGTISASLPPLGWEKPFSDTGKAAYRSLNTMLPTRPFLRIVDALDPAWPGTYAKYAKVGIVEFMSDINTMSGVQAPFDNSNHNKNWIGKGAYTNAQNGWAKFYYAFGDGSNEFTLSETNIADVITPTAGIREYFIIGNGEFFYIANKLSPSKGEFCLNGFGVFESLFDADSSNWFLGSNLSYQYPAEASSGNTRSNFQALTQSNYGNNICILGPVTGESECEFAAPLVAGLINTGAINYSSTSNIIGSVQYGDVLIKDRKCIRGILPSIKWLYQNKPYSSKEVILDGDTPYLVLNIETSIRQHGQIMFKLE